MIALVACSSSGGGPSSTPAPRPAPNGGPYTNPNTPTATTPGGGLLYRPTPAASYAYQRRDSLALQLPGGATQVQQFNRTAFLTVSLAPEGAAYRATIHLDSLRQEAGGTLPADSLLRAEGTRWTGLVSAEGKLTDLRPDRSSGVIDQIGGSLPALFPVLPPGGVREGLAWSDTAQRTLKADAFDATERAATDYRAVKSDGRALVIESLTAFQRAGKGSQPTDPMEMASQGTRHGTYRFGDGGVLSAEGADSAEMTITVPAVGQTVPVSQRATWRINAVGKGAR
jgi:hypothetical protein